MKYLNQLDHPDIPYPTDAATEEMNGEYIRLIRPLVNDFKATLLYEQKKLDNRENYRFESGICKGRP